jgi:hypothetical protein
LPGTSFYGVLNRASTAQVPEPARDFTFSRYLDHNTAVTRPGLYGGVCGRAQGRAGRPADDVVRAGSCVWCDADTDCDDQDTDTPCLTLGKVCVNSASHPNGKAGRCAPNYTTPCVKDQECPLAVLDSSRDPERFCKYEIADIGDRCGSCGEHQTCQQVRVPCNECVDAVWKLKRKKENNVGLWELATNPEEDAKLDCSGDNALVDSIEDCLETQLCGEEGFPCSLQGPPGCAPPS